MAKAEVGAKIKQARAAKGWKQKHLAAEVSVEPITVSRWERGATTPDFDALSLVAEATGRPLSYFLDSEPENGDRDSAATLQAVAAAVERVERRIDALAATLEEIRTELARR